ncbi:hypothetical protein GS597_02195 [Synechococcales cyanobacterium C]|uniref:Uncharacterized protein n=1 Tax=Petrachloros mirabilis ULC683 TaxID=2781853 RepID=A0A8K1ZWU0_9CYAN|nr:hypothetical protein [Petrachloros mirabilis]NCJ05342.1 hypothetical protein [Petrachloros mirabilis ULC683]
MTERWTDETLDRFASTVATATQANQELITKNTEAIAELKDDLKAESRKWDERYFQLTRDTLGTAKTIIVTAGTVVILSPLLQALSPAIEKIVTRLLGGQT